MATKTTAPEHPLLGQREVVWLDELSDRDTPTGGGKATNLARLMRADLAVPGGFVVTATAYQHAAEAAGVRDELRCSTAWLAYAGSEGTATAGQLASLATRLEAPANLATTIAEAYRTLDPTDAAVAVRSSATAKDAAEASVPGMHPTFVWVSGIDDLLARIADCWRSLYTPRLVANRAQRQLTDEPAIAVVVQRMIDADRTGVDPTLGRGPGGDVARATIPPEQAVAPSLSGDEAARVAQLARDVATLYEQPMDIEFAFCGDDLWLLQARPITTLGPPTLPGPPQAPRSWPSRPAPPPRDQ